MDGLQVFNVDEVPPDTKMNKVARRVIIDVANAASLPSSPATGMHAFLLDTGELCWYNGTSWHTYPKGQVDHGSLTTTGNTYDINPGLGQVDINDSLLTIATSGNSWYKYTINIALNGTTADDVFQVKLWRGATQIGLQRDLIIVGPIDSANRHWTISEIDNPAAGTFVYKATVQAISGNAGGGRIMGGTDVWVEHLGGQVP